jgi:hypothetical protein
MFFRKPAEINYFSQQNSAISLFLILSNCRVYIQKALEFQALIDITLRIYSIITLLFKLK